MKKIVNLDHHNLRINVFRVQNMRSHGFFLKTAEVKNINNSNWNLERKSHVSEAVNIFDRKEIFLRLFLFSRIK